ncbi:hypothetical protein CQU01_27160 [Cerasibacillus quisquiliarum]|uniref:Uncharacterized protein n=2 Tax=Cerasibacillus quisquiliarum TaxID=227865 RepID=A0A511V3I6_9BACI|nr:hypothetical protein CQU01_27160 [Cerasibacillus quisquiliarum]
MVFVNLKVSLAKGEYLKMIYRQLNKLDEKDFAVLRGPLESGRQSPKSIGRILILSVFLQTLLFFLTYVVAADHTKFPFKDILFYLHLVGTAILILFSILYSIPFLYKKKQKTQYLISILVSQNFGLFFVISSLFLIGSDRIFIINEGSLVKLTIIMLLLGFLLLIVTRIRFSILLSKGEYRLGSKKAQLRTRFEAKSLLPIAIIAGTGISLLLQYIFKNMISFDGHIMMIILLGPLLFYTMLFVLPEQLVILYCKTRFDSFNFDHDGNLNPFSSEETEVNGI